MRRSPPPASRSFNAEYRGSAGEAEAAAADLCGRARRAPAR
jgi:hypothetical protein